MTTNPLIAAYDKSVAAALCSVGLTRKALGTYVRTDGEGVWQGVWLSFNSRSPHLRAAPNLCLFCPQAAKIVNQGLQNLYGKEAGGRRPALGGPFISEPLYHLARQRGADDRYPFSYDVEANSGIKAATKLVLDDFSKVAGQFFHSSKNIEELRNRIVSHPSNTAAGIYAMVLSYLIEPGINLTELKHFIRLSPNEMTKKFALYFGAWVVEERKRK